jgi:hypothetical protein
MPINRNGHPFARLSPSMMRHRFLALTALALGALAAPATAVALSPPSVIVAVQPVNGINSYFHLPAHPGTRVYAGRLQLTNTAARTSSVTVDPANASTATSFGSAYSMRGTPPKAQATWIDLPQRVVTLGPHASTTVPVYIRVPATAAPGDYLSGIAVQATGPADQTTTHGRFQISSIERYAIGVLVALPGPRNPLITFSGATVDHAPSGLTFYLDAHNAGNSLLQNVTGTALITTTTGKLVAQVPLGPGTFVNGTSVAYPVLVPRIQPAEGTSFRVRASLRYGAKTAYLDTLVKFGHAAAVSQAQFGGPSVLDSSHGGGVSLAAVLGVLVALGGLGGAAFFVLRRRRHPSGERAALKAIEQGLQRSRAIGVPLEQIALRDAGRAALAAGALSVARRHVRSVDRLVTLDDGALVVLDGGTPHPVAEMLAGELSTALRGHGHVAATAVSCAADAPPQRALRGAMLAGKIAADAVRASAAAPAAQRNGAGAAPAPADPWPGLGAELDRPPATPDANPLAGAPAMRMMGSDQDPR